MTTAAPVKRRRRAWWMVSAREARHHAIMLAAITWLVSIVTTVAGTGRTNFVGLLNGPDFVHFYTFGLLAREGRIADAYNWEILQATQVAIAPETVNQIHPPVYPPQTALPFMPLSLLSLTNALRAWTAVTVLLYGLIVWWTWRTLRDHLPDPVLIFAAAAGFPPFWHTVMNGEATILIVGACFLAWLALERGRSFLAGCALGLLAIKPQFGIPFAVIVLIRREWSMLAGALVSAGVQTLVVWIVFGKAAFTGFAAIVPVIAAHADEMEPKPFQSHSIRALTRVLPGWSGMLLWLVVSGVVLWRTAVAWAADAPMSVRLGLALLASVLVNPHVILYDATILVLPILWFGAWLSGDASSDEAMRYGAAVYLLFFTLLFPTAAFIRIQVSVLVMLWLFWMVQRRALGTTPRQPAWIHR